MFVAPTITGPLPESVPARSSALEARLRPVDRLRPVSQDGNRLDLNDSRRSRQLAFGRSEAEDRRAAPAKPNSPPALLDRAQVRDIPVIGQANAAFLAHLLGQDESGPIIDQGAGPDASFGSEAYRRAGGEPLVFPETPAYFRVSV